MRRRRRAALAGGVAVGLGSILITTGGAAATPGQHGGDEGHLTGDGEWGKIELVGQVEVTQTEGLVADVAAYGDYAYLANWGEEDCAGPEKGGVTTPDSGAWVIDISDPANPVEVGFIAMPQDTRPGEGMQVVHLETAKFTGDVLVMNAEACGKNYKGGFMLYDVTDPLKPKKLKEGFGDRTGSDAHQTHSAFVWQHEGSAYLVAQDEEDTFDVDIYDITNPKRPRMVTELDLNKFGVAQYDLNLADSNLHDMTVRCFGADEAVYPGRCIMIASYWDGGYVLLDVTDPATPVFLDDTEFAPVDPELLEQTGAALTPEGNAHQAEFTMDGRFFIATDEDFNPFRAVMTTDDGDTFPAGEFAWTVPLTELADGVLDGPTVYGGLGCPADRGAIPSADSLDLAEGQEAILVTLRGDCFFSEKVETAQLLGYDAVVVANSHAGALGGLAPDQPICGSRGHDFEVLIPAVCVGHRAVHELFDVTAGYAAGDALPAVGTVGDVIAVESQFDGWGYVHLFDSQSLTDLDTFAVPEAMDEQYARDFGDLSVHEVATDPLNPSMAYLAYYGAGLRAIQIVCDGVPYDPATTTDTAGCELVEVGGYLDEEGNNFWGVEVIPNPHEDPDVVGDEVLILASDRDYGLFIFVDP